MAHTYLLPPVERSAMKIHAVVYEAEEGGYWAKVPSLPGVYTQGETLEELEANLREAVEVYLSDDTQVAVMAATENGRVLEIAV
jgi:predicted RNase H-like HicB family nuclease